MTAIEKQIQAAEKRIEKFEKNVSMYNERAEKKLQQLQKLGYSVSMQDFEIKKTGRWKYDYDIVVSVRVKQQVPFALYIPVLDNIEKKQENMDRLADERREREEKIRQMNESRMKRQSEDENAKPLVEKFTSALQPFRSQWMKNMMDWHARFYVRIHQALPNARKQYDELAEIISGLYRANGYRPNAKIRQHEAAKASFGRILSAPPTKYDTLDGYMRVTKDELEKEFDTCIRILADKCIKFQVNTAKVEVKHPRMGERGFDVLVQDRPDRVIDARMIWAAEYSEYMVPHTRYIVTERHIAQQATKDRRITDASLISKDGHPSVRCRVDGVMQMSMRLDPDDMKALEAVKNQTAVQKQEVIDSIARKYFDTEAVEQKRGRGR